MIKLTPSESLYFKEVIINCKRNKDVAKKANVTAASVGTTLSVMLKRIGMTRFELREKYLNGEIEIEFTQKPLKIIKEIRLGDKERIRLMKKLGFTDEEIIKELKDK